MTLQAHIYLLFYKIKIINACLGGITIKECDGHSGQGNLQNTLGVKNKYPQADFFKKIT